MTSLWKDLLFLHGYLVRKEDLLWHNQTPPESTAKAPATSHQDGPADTGLKRGTKPPKRQPPQRPRLAIPR